MPFCDDDLDTFFSDFADIATKGADTFSVIFDEDANDYNSVAGTVTATGPEIKVKTSDVELFSLKKGDSISINGKTWNITSPAKNFEPGIKLFKLQGA